MTNRFAVYLENACTGMAYPAVRPSDVASFRFPMPLLQEQRAIAEVLDSIDEAIERTDAVIAATERLRDSLLHELLTRGIPGWHTEWKQVPRLNKMPATWMAIPLRDLLVLNQPGAWGDEPTADDPGVRVLRAANLTRDGRVTPERAARRRLSPRDRDRRLLLDGDLMLERSGGGRGTPVGRVALIDGFGPVYCSNFCQQLRFDNSRIRPRYAHLSLWHRYTRGVTIRLEHQTTGIRNLDYQGYLSFPVPLPPLAEQRVIEDCLDCIESAIAAVHNECTALQSTIHSTADALLSGRVRLTGISDA